MTDRELLEAAAKAADIDLVPYVWNKGTGFDNEGFTVAGKGGLEWNPLEDDGDALRLAVKLGISFGLYTGLAKTWASCGHHKSKLEYHGSDACAATRRAIVRAAAAIAGAA
jgi:hypothetical protein